MNKSLELKSIYELLYNEEGKPESFFIPSYQRGYRWTTQQVEELLEDILEFDTDVRLEKNKGFYCLQPIVVKRSNNSNYKWDVIDGQQRLTTIFIILKTAEEILKNYDLEIYKIGYETRKSSAQFLETKLSQIDETNIDFFHMSKTYETVINWFAKRNSKMTIIDRLKIKPIFDKGIDKAKSIRVIWYEIEDKENDTIDGDNKYKKDIEIFTRINMGKIPLTNAELIKALLIQGYGVNKKIKDNRQFELASEWDFIEYSLQNDDFWYFINKDKNEKSTRIEFIFELITEKYLKDIQDFDNPPNESIDKYYQFHIINHYLQNDNRNYDEKEKESIDEKLWSEVKNYFRILNEWYEDREFFHKIGFLVIHSKTTILNFIDTYTDEEESITKSDFMKYLDKKMMEVFKNKNEDVDIESLKYDNTIDKVLIEKILLLFNIDTILQNKESNMRFQFDRYKKQNWDIEHIRSQSDKYPKKSEKEAWIRDILDIAKTLTTVKVGKTEDEVLKMNERKFNQFFDEIQKQIEGADSDFDKHSIGNLTLLDVGTNRSYGNAFFPIKRKIIIENDMSGTFIPICTKNLFLKYYTKNATNLQLWTRDDAKSYKNAIIKTFDEIKRGTYNEQK